MADQDPIEKVFTGKGTVYLGDFASAIRKHENNEYKGVDDKALIKNWLNLNREAVPKDWLSRKFTDVAPKKKEESGPGGIASTALKAVQTPILEGARGVIEKGVGSLVNTTGKRDSTTKALDVSYDEMVKAGVWPPLARARSFLAGSPEHAKTPEALKTEEKSRAEYGKFTKGFTEGAADVGVDMTSPANMAMLAASFLKLPKAIAKFPKLYRAIKAGASGAFSVTMLRDLSDEIPAMKEAIDKGDNEAAGKAAAKAIADIFFATATTKEAVHQGGKLARSLGKGGGAAELLTSEATGGRPKVAPKPAATTEPPATRGEAPKPTTLQNRSTTMVTPEGKPVESPWVASKADNPEVIGRFQSTEKTHLDAVGRHRELADRLNRAEQLQKAIEKRVDEVENGPSAITSEKTKGLDKDKTLLEAQKAQVEKLKPLVETARMSMLEAEQDHGIASDELKKRKLQVPKRPTALNEREDYGPRKKEGPSKKDIASDKAEREKDRALKNQKELNPDSELRPGGWYRTTERFRMPSRRTNFGKEARGTEVTPEVTPGTPVFYRGVVDGQATFTLPTGEEVKLPPAVTPEALRRLRIVVPPEKQSFPPGYNPRSDPESGSYSPPAARGPEGLSGGPSEPPPTPPVQPTVEPTTPPAAPQTEPAAANEPPQASPEQAAELERLKKENEALKAQQAPPAAGPEKITASAPPAAAEVIPASAEDMKWIDDHMNGLNTNPESRAKIRDLFSKYREAKNARNKFVKDNPSKTNKVSDWPEDVQTKFKALSAEERRRADAYKKEFDANTPDPESINYISKEGEKTEYVKTPQGYKASPDPFKEMGVPSAPTPTPSPAAVETPTPKPMEAPTSAGEVSPVESPKPKPRPVKSKFPPSVVAAWERMTGDPTSDSAAKEFKKKAEAAGLNVNDAFQGIKAERSTPPPARETAPPTSDTPPPARETAGANQPTAAQAAELDRLKKENSRLKGEESTGEDEVKPVKKHLDTAAYGLANARAQGAKIVDIQFLGADGQPLAPALKFNVATVTPEVIADFMAHHPDLDSIRFKIPQPSGKSANMDFKLTERNPEEVKNAGKQAAKKAPAESAKPTAEDKKNARMAKELEKLKAENAKLKGAESPAPPEARAAETEPSQLFDRETGFEAQNGQTYEVHTAVADPKIGINPGDKLTYQGTHPKTGASSFVLEQPNGQKSPLIVQEEDIDTVIEAIDPSKKSAAPVKEDVKTPVDISGLEKQYDITSKTADRFKKKDSTRVEPGTSGTESQQARTSGGKVKLGADVKSLGEVLGASLYSGKTPHVISKELMQNAADAVRGIKGGKFSLDVDRYKHTVTVEDSGKGMTPDEVATVFTDLGASGKRGEAEASGGFGLAKAAPLMKGEWIDLSTVAKVGNQKIRTTLRATPEELLGEGVDLKQEVVPNDTPTGTKIISKIPEGSEGWWDAERFANNFNKSVKPPGETSIKTGGYETKSLDRKLKKVDSIKTGGADADIYVGHESNPEGIGIGEMMGVIEVEINNNGIYQFDDSIYLGDGAKVKGVPKVIAIDIKATVPEGDQNYPFTANREKLRGDAVSKVKDYVTEKYIKPGIEKANKFLEDKYNNLPTVGSKDFDIVAYDSGARMTPKEFKEITTNPDVVNLSEHIAVALNDALSRIASRDSMLPSGLSGLGDNIERPGIVFAQNLHGVHITNRGTGKATVFVNPFSFTEDSSPFEAASLIWHTLKHEILHDKVKGHYGEFTIGEAKMAGVLGELEIQSMLRLKGAYEDPANPGKFRKGIDQSLQIYNEAIKRQSTENDPFGGEESRTGNEAPPGKRGGSQAVPAGEQGPTGETGANAKRTGPNPPEIRPALGKPQAKSGFPDSVMPHAQYRKGTVFTNPSALKDLWHFFGNGSEGAPAGIYTDKEFAKEIVGYLNKKYPLMYKELTTALEKSIEEKGYALLVGYGKGDKLSKVKQAYRHEFFHLIQDKTATPENLGGRIDKMIAGENGASAKRAIEGLANMGYTPSIDVIWHEIGAHLATGPMGWETLGLNKQEAMGLFKSYLEAWDTPDDLDIKRIAPEMAKVINEQRKQTSPVYGKGRGKAAAAGQGGEGGDVRPGVRPVISTGEPPKARGQ